MHVSAPCAGVLRVQYNRAHNYALSSRLQKCKLCLRHSCPFTTFYERRKAISIAAERGTARLMQRLQMFGSVHWRINGIVVLLGAHQLQCLVLPQAHQLHFSIIIIALEWGWEGELVQL